jgi:hypothetical protein
MTAQRAISAVVLNMALGFGFVANAQLTPLFLPPPYVNIALTGGNGGNGSNADCNTHSTPNDGHVGKTPSDSITSITIDVSTPDFNSVVFVSSTGGTGGTGGEGSSCYAGRGGGDGGPGGSITVNNGSSTNAPVLNVSSSAIYFRWGGKAVRVALRAILRGLVMAAMAAWVGPSP